MNLALILVTLTAISGIFILIDIIYWKKKKNNITQESGLKKIFIWFEVTCF